MGTGQGSGHAGRHLGTHADVQVLQEVLQQAGAQAKRPHPLVAPRGLDPWAQVLGKRGASYRCPAYSHPSGCGGQCARSEQAPCAVHPAPSLRPAGLAHGHGHPEQVRHTEGQGVPRSGSVLPQPTAVLQGQEAMPQATAGQSAIAMAPEGQECMSGAPQGLSIPAPCDGGQGRTSSGPPSGSGTAPICIPAQAGEGPPAAHRPPPPPCIVQHTVPTASLPRGSAHPPHTSTMTCRPWGVMFR